MASISSTTTKKDAARAAQVAASLKASTTVPAAAATIVTGAADAGQDGNSHVGDTASQTSRKRKAALGVNPPLSAVVPNLEDSASVASRKRKADAQHAEQARQIYEAQKATEESLRIQESAREALEVSQQLADKESQNVAKRARAAELKAARAAAKTGSGPPLTNLKNLVTGQRRLAGDHGSHVKPLHLDGAGTPANINAGNAVRPLMIVSQTIIPTLLPCKNYPGRNTCAHTTRTVVCATLVPPCFDCHPIRSYPNTPTQKFTWPTTTTGFCMREVVDGGGQRPGSHPERQTWYPSWAPNQRNVIEGEPHQVRGLRSHTERRTGNFHVCTPNSSYGAFPSMSRTPDNGCGYSSYVRTPNSSCYLLGTSFFVPYTGTLGVFLPTIPPPRSHPERQERA